MGNPMQPQDLQGGIAILTSYYVGFPEQMGAVGDKLAPPLPVDAMEGKVLVEDYGTSRRREKMSRAVGGKFWRSGPALTSVDYLCKEEGHEVPLDDLIVRNNPAQINVDKIHAKRAGRLCTLEREIKIATKARNTANHFSTSHYDTLSGPDLWSDYESSKPNQPVKDLMLSIYHDSGVMPGEISMIIPVTAFETLRLNPHVAEQVKYTMASLLKNMTPDLIKQYMGCKEVFVAGMLQNTAGEGLPEVISEIWGDDIILFYADPRPLQETANFMVSPSLYGTTVVQISTYRDETIKSDIYRAEYCTDDGMIATARAGAVLKNVI